MGMKVLTATFVKSAAKPADYPSAGLPEFAFAGRSNVGKSSLINTLANRKRLVKTSSTPGRTQLINFFEINNTISLVDLPGYGWAKVPYAVQKKWGPMIETYLQTRKTLKAVVIIMDIRRLPRQEEFDLMAWLADARIPGIPVLTKSDKISKTNRIKQIQNISEALKFEKGTVTLFSSKTRLGRDDLWDKLMDFIA